MSATNAVFYISILVMSIVIHEVAHGFAAEYFGDRTARFAGRLTLNPLKHLDLFGSILLPVVLVLSHSPFLFGWAKPVPYNPDNLTNRKWGTLAVASAGVLANFFIAIIFGIIIRLTSDMALPEGFYFITSIIVLLNLGLAIFNLVPIPPLDGSRVISSLLPPPLTYSLFQIERWGTLIILALYFSGILMKVLVPGVDFFARLLNVPQINLT